MTTKHTLAARLARGEALYGLITKMPSPATVEMAGYAGFDIVVIDTEHGLADSADLEHHIRAADSAGIPVVVRVGANEPVAILRALDARAEGVIVPHVSSRKDAQAAVSFAHYPPRGTRGFAVSTRAGHFGAVSLDQHFADAADTLVVAQVEDKEAATRTAAIADVPGLTAVWIGPSDLSLSLGFPGQFDHPEVVAAMTQITTDVNGSSDCALCVLVDSPEDAAGWRERGASILLFNATTMLAKEMRDIIATVRSAAPVGKERIVARTEAAQHLQPPPIEA